ncbi:MAG: T9SS type A sorting domain-containing protein [Candidatus Kapabacteria bacterium]|nr:T9SS type A sorting domain-containing protein [Candidatus Kapabacteria bacterium]
MKNYLNINFKLILILSISLIVNHYNLFSQYQDSCLGKGFLRFHDSTLIQHFKLFHPYSGVEVDTEKVRIRFTDFTSKGEQIIIGDYGLIEGNTIKNNIVLIKKGGRWVTFLNDSMKIRNDSIFKSYSQRRITDYKVVDNYIYVLCGGLGMLYVDTVNGKNGDMTLNKAYIFRINTNDIKDIKQVFLTENYYAESLFCLSNGNIIVKAYNKIYTYTQDLSQLIKIKNGAPNEIKDYFLLQYFPITQDSIYFLYCSSNNANNKDNDYRLYFSSNGANTFSRINLPINSTGGLNFKNSKDGYFSIIITDSTKRLYAKIFKTIDGGLNWTLFTNIKTSKIIFENWDQQIPANLKFYNKNRTMILQSYYNEIDISNDYGVNWDQIIPDSGSCKSHEKPLEYNLETFNLAYYNNTMYIPNVDDYNYTYFTYTNPTLLDVSDEENNLIYDLSTSKLLVTGDYFYLNDFKDKLENTNYEIYNLTGEILNCQKYENNKIDISFLNSGTYILRIENKTFIFIKAE